MTTMENPGVAMFSGFLSALREWNSAMTSSPNGLRTAWDALARWQQEAAQFLDRRLLEDRRSWEALLASRDPAGAMKVQEEWMAKAAADYGAEVERTLQLAALLSFAGTPPAIDNSAMMVD